MNRPSSWPNTALPRHLAMAKAEYSVKVSGVGRGVGSNDVRRVFEDKGYRDITDVYMPPGKEFGFVRFSNEDEANRAVEQQGIVVRGMELGLELAVSDKKFGKGKSGKGSSGFGQDMLPSMPSRHREPERESAASSKKGGSGEHSIWVGNLPKRATSSGLKELFNQKGIENMTDVYAPPGRGFGFVRFATREEVDDAMTLCEDLRYGDNELELKSSVTDKKGPPPARDAGPFFADAGYGRDAGYSKGQSSLPAKSSTGEYSLWVGNLPDDCSTQELREVFEGRGVTNMSDVYIPGKAKGFGFVRFTSPEQVDAAMEICQGLQLGGRDLELKVSQIEKRGSAAAAPPSVGVGYPTGWIPAGYGMGMGMAYMDDGYGMQGPSAKKLSSNEHSVWVGNLPKSITSEELGDAFRSRGIETMTDVYIPKGDKGFAFVRFGTRREVENAVDECQGLTIAGKEVELKISSTEKRTSPAAASNGPPLAYGYPGGCHGFGYGMAYADDGYGSYGDYGGYGPYGPGSAPTAARKGGGKDRSAEISVKVSNLPKGISSEDLRAAFAEQGVDTMTDVYIPLGKPYGFLRFMRMSEAESALNLNGCQFGDSEIQCELAEGKAKSSQEMDMKNRMEPPIAYHRSQDAFDTSFVGKDGGEVSVKVGNLPADISHEELCEAFAEQGIDFMTDVYIPQGRRFGFVRFATADEGKQAVQRRISINGQVLELELATNKKRGAEEMAGGEIGRHERNVQPRESREASSREAPDNPDVSADAPSLKVSNIPRGTTSEELHQAVVDAGCTGSITDVYIPKGNRGFGFVRFDSRQDTEAAARLKVFVKDSAVDLEVAVAPRKGGRDAAAGRGNAFDFHDRQDFGYGFPQNGGYGCGLGMKGFGPAKGKGMPAFGFGMGPMGPYGMKGPMKGGYW